MHADDPVWSAVDEYFAENLAPHDEALANVRTANAEGRLPAIDVSQLQGRMLQVLARSVAAKSILEVGTLGGYSTIWLARSLPAGGRVVTLELEPAHAAVARRNLERAGVADAVELILGPAVESLARLIADGRGPFDLIFVDADKPSNPEYFQAALKLSRPGTLIVVDNVVRAGAVADPTSTDASVLGVRRLVEMLANEPRVCASAVQTVGAKGYDGFVIAVVLE